jgi:hypothetical protein
MGKPEGMRPLGRRRYRWEDNIKMYIREIECGGVEWIDLARNRDHWRALVNTVVNLGSSVKYLKIHEQLSDRRLVKKDSALWS